MPPLPLAAAAERAETASGEVHRTGEGESEVVNGFEARQRPMEEPRRRLLGEAQRALGGDRDERLSSPIASLAPVNVSSVGASSIAG